MIITRYFTLFLITLFLSTSNLYSKDIAFIPKKLDKWKWKDKEKYYNTEQLWEYIDGAAESYISYGFKKLTVINLIDKVDNSDVSIEIYEMKDKLNAFGIYSSERHPDYNFINVGTQGYISEPVLIFYKGDYLIKLMSYSSSNNVKSSLLNLANIISDRIKDNDGFPQELGFFPKGKEDGLILIPNSEKFISQGFLGQDYFLNAFTADYKNSDNTLADLKSATTVFFIRNVTNDNFLNYKQFISETGKITSDASFSISFNEHSEKFSNVQGFIGEDIYYGKIIVVLKDDLLVGALNVSDTIDVLKLLIGLMTNIKQN